MDRVEQIVQAEILRNSAKAKLMNEPGLETMRNSFCQVAAALEVCLAAYREKTVEEP